MTATVFTILLLAQALTPEVIEHTQAGAEAQKQGHLDQAIAEFRKVVELQPTGASGYASLGGAYFQQGNYELAIPALEQAVKLSPELLGAHQMLGVSLLVRGDAAGALPHLEKTHVPDLLGLAYLETGRLGSAIAALQAALAQRPNDPDLLYYFGRATSLASKRAFDQIVEKDAASARAHEVAGDRYFEQGQVREAGKEYFEVVRLAPHTAGAHIALGQTLAAVGNWSAAVTEFKAETQLRPDNAEAFFRLGSALLQQNQNPEALTALTRANTLGPDTPAILLALGQAAQLTGDSARAEKSWARLLEVQKQGDLAAQAHSRLEALYRKSGRTDDADREKKEYEKTKGAGKP
jgi:tetratricopeptide (TPR) repeat protein